jgi:nucleoside-diphosphate-sugar epimerase
MFSFIHAHDAAMAILAAVERPAAGGVLNIVDDRPTLVHDWLPEMAAMLAGPAPAMFPPGSPGGSWAAGAWPT